MNLFEYTENPNYPKHSWKFLFASISGFILGYIIASIGDDKFIKTIFYGALINVFIFLCAVLKWRPHKAKLFDPTEGGDSGTEIVKRASLFHIPYKNIFVIMLILSIISALIIYKIKTNKSNQSLERTPWVCCFA